MAQTYDIGPAFVHTIRLKKTAPFFHTADSFETDDPFRYSRSLIVHFKPSGFGLVFGLWRNTGYTEEEAMMAAMMAKEIVPWWKDSPAKADDVRKMVARRADSVDTELAVLDALGLME